MTSYTISVMKDMTRDFVEDSYKKMHEAFIKLNEQVQKGKLSAEDFVKKRTEIIKEYQLKRKAMEDEI